MPRCITCVTAGLTCEYRPRKRKKAGNEPVASDASSGPQSALVVAHIDMPGRSTKRASSLGVEQSVAR
jgi:hypothetical protein